MNPAIEKLEKRKADYIYESNFIRKNHGYEPMAEQLDESIEALEALKACVEAINEHTYDFHEESGNLYCVACGTFQDYPHKPTCRFNNALALVNRAMGVSHE